MSGVVMHQPAFIDFLEHPHIAERPKLFVGGPDDEAHGPARNETVRKLVPAVGERHAEHADRVHASAPGKFLHLVVGVEAVHQLHVTTPGHVTTPLS